MIFIAFISDAKLSFASVCKVANLASKWLQILPPNMTAQILVVFEI